MENEEQKQKRPAELFGERLRMAASNPNVQMWLHQELERRKKQENQDYADTLSCKQRYY